VRTDAEKFVPLAALNFVDRLADVGTKTSS